MEANRWYSPSGEEVYRIIGANGKERDVNIRDARRLELKPSITTILRLVRNEGIDRYRMMQYISAARTAPSIEGETEQEMIERIINDADEHSRNARTFGTDIHRIIEGLINGSNVAEVAEFSTSQQLVIFELAEYIKNMEFVGDCERVIVGEHFGGRLDFVGTVKGHDRPLIIDFKTQSTSDKFKFYPEWLYQLGGQWMLMWEADKKPQFDIATLAISTIVPGLIELKVYPESDLDHGSNVFEKLLYAFYAIKKLEAHCE
jgi:hypothetical protein